MNGADEDQRHDTFLIRLVRALFSEPTLSAIVYPAIADMRHELRDAGSSRRLRLLAR